MGSRGRGKAADGGDGIDRSEAARALGSVRSEAKKEAARERYARQVELYGAPRQLKPLEEIACNCGAGMNLEGHKSTCMRGRAIKRRKEKGQPLQ